MSKERDGHAGVVLMAFVMGAITGAAAALLVAPTTGSETRRVLNEKANEGREKATVVAQEGRKFVQRQREHFSTAIDRGRDAYQHAREGEQQPAEDEE